MAATALCGLVGLGSETGWGYRFYRSFDGDSLTPPSDSARRWQSAVWGRGDTLVWHVLDDPLWQPHSSESGEVLPSVEESLDTWARIPSADGRWRVDGILPREQASGDDRNTVSVEETEDWGGQARRRSRSRGGGPWETVECDVVLSASRRRTPPSCVNVGVSDSSGSSSAP